jgi:hypothetical protein
MKSSEYYRSVLPGVFWVFLLGLVVVGFMMFHLLTKGIANAPTIACLSHLRSIHRAGMSWAQEMQASQLPTNFIQFTAQIKNPGLLHCPWDHTNTTLSAWSELSPSNTSYVIRDSGPGFDGTNAYAVCTFHNYFIMKNGDLSHDKRGKVRRVSP